MAGHNPASNWRESWSELCMSKPEFGSTFANAHCLARNMMISDQRKEKRITMLEYMNIPGTNLISARIALGTWAIGGWMWGGTDEKESIRTIHAALDQGVNLIDTAPVYGQGRSEEIVGEAVHQYGRRDNIILATKVGLDWTTGSIERNSSRER